MKKPLVIFVCTHCDAQFSKWMGRCEGCGSWGTLTQQAAMTATPRAERQAALEHIPEGNPVPFMELAQTSVQRMRSGIAEFDRVIGGGIVPGSLLLLGGDPGIGKSTLVAQIAASVPGVSLYVSGEESGAQIKLRLDRLGIDQSHIHFLGEEHVEVICKTVLARKPAFAIIDSIQTVASSAAEGEPGSVTQIKAATVRFLETAKQSGIPIMIIGHVTKGGELGGPKTLEHLVDTVLYLEGEHTHQFRMLRSAKNRFGATNETGVFTMEQRGLQSVADPSAIFCAERSRQSGSVMTAVVEGSRVLLLEVQALVTPTTFGFPQRKCSGYDVNRLAMLCAVAQRHLDFPAERFDIHVNIAGGLRISEPAMDLAVLLALLSSQSNAIVDEHIVAFGEVGLGGEIRSVARMKDRIMEAKRFGLTRALSPKTVTTLRDAIRTAKLN